MLKSPKIKIDQKIASTLIIISEIESESIIKKNYTQFRYSLLIKPNFKFSF